MTSRKAEPLPRIVAWLGYGGLIPFVALAAGAVISGSASSPSVHTPPLWQAALVVYGAAILSFVGALHWGFAMALRGLTAPQRAACFVWSVVPALVAWVACIASIALLVPTDASDHLPPGVAPALLVAGFCVHYARDRSLAAHADLPAWYLPMRFRLTTVACLCLTVPILASFLSRFLVR